MEWQFRSADASRALGARHAFLEFIREACTAHSDCDAAEIVFGELVANVIQHAPGPIEITVRSDARGLVTLDVCDTGVGFAIAPALPLGGSESGRGLYIISRLCPHLSSARTITGNRVRVVLPVIAQRQLSESHTGSHSS
ncbi:MAG: ATP-binding protein [Vulcanimicrobiaceae bacterium]